MPEALFGQTWIDIWWPLILPFWFGGGAMQRYFVRGIVMSGIKG